ncbi:MAG: branched-chain amino acid ABC transporter permease, partial [Chloroflexota bacterium]
FLMITLALAMLSFTFALQNRTLTRGFSGITGIRPPTFGSFSLEEPRNFYYVSLIIALLIYFGLRYIVKSQFGLALQAIRDNARRMAALGYNVNAHRVTAFTLAAFVAGVAGLLGVWYNGQMTPGSIDLTRNINILLIAVMGGLLYFEGSFIGAIFFILVTTFASSFTTRFNTLIGIAFLLISLFLPNGIMGLLDTSLKLVSNKKDSIPQGTPKSSASAEGG